MTQSLAAQVALLRDALEAAHELEEWFMKHSRAADYDHRNRQIPLHETGGWNELIDAGYNGLMASYNEQFREPLAATTNLVDEIRQATEWQLIENGPVNIPVLLWCKELKNRTDIVGIISQYEDGLRFASSSSARNFEFTHCALLRKPPTAITAKEQKE